MGFKRDLSGKGQPQGTCVLLEVPSLDSLVHYFQSTHNNDIFFEVKGVQIENVQNRMVSQNSLNETINFNLSCAVALYSLWVNAKVYLTHSREPLQQPHEINSKFGNNLW